MVAELTVVLRVLRRLVGTSTEAEVYIERPTAALTKHGRSLPPAPPPT